MTMYLSRLILDPRSRLVRRDLSDCQQMHRTLLSVFHIEGDIRSARSRVGLLYRVEESRSGIVVLAQSRAEPDWTRVPEGYLAPPDDFDLEPIDNSAVKAVDAQFAYLPAGLRLAFRLCANPTRKIDTKSGPAGNRRNGRRVELRGDDRQRAWLDRKGTLHGFEVLSVELRPPQRTSELRVIPQDKVRGRHAHAADDSRRPLTFGSVLYEGALRITDAAKFRSALESGIGSGKAYGFGLLSIAPLR